MNMKKKTIVYVLIIFMVIFSFNVKSYALLQPRQAISSNNYSANEDMTLDEKNEIEVGETLHLYPLVISGHDMEEPYGMFVVKKVDLSIVAWATSDANIATVDNTGKVTGISEGKVTITAKFDEPASFTDRATYEINVNSKGDTDITGISFADNGLKQAPSMILNQEHDFLIYLDNIPDTEKKNIKITIDNESVAKLNDINLYNWEQSFGRGIIIANVSFLSLGQAKITATLDYDGQTYSDSYTFEVVESMYTMSMSMKNYIDLVVGTELKLNVEFIAPEGSSLPEDITSTEIVWTSSDEKILTVNNMGLVTAVGEGTAIITATYKIEDKTLTADCIVIAKEPVHIVDKDPTQPGENSYKLSMSTEMYTDLAIGNHLQLNATLTLGGSIPPKDVTSDGVVWTSSDEKILKVDNKGLVTAVGEGTATITAEYKIADETLIATCIVTAKEPVHILDKDPTQPGGKLGDVDGNENITTKDAKMVLQHIVKKITLTDEQFKRADTDKNERITTKDAKMILQHIVKKIVLQ